MTEVQRLEDDGTELVPIYTLEQLVYRVKNNLPITKKETDEYNIERPRDALYKNNF
ncbi:TPA: hypothetical protein R1915_001057 [Staphylococcus delphini]|nr:hypothetical protein [Staphylococcus delphini]